MNPTIPKLTDDAVSRLPLEAGRAELLEEIMSTVAPDRTTDRPTPVPSPSTGRWLAPVVAAAVVVGIVAGSLWAAGLLPDDERSMATQPVEQAGNRAVLEAPGWEVTSTESGDDGYGEVGYEKGGARFTITWYPATSYESYVADREHISDPPAPGQPVEVLGRPGQLWAYDAQDHTVIREVEDGFWIELRGSGMDEAAYRALLGQLKMVGSAGYEASLPDEFVTADERGAAIASMLDGITAASGAEGPNGVRVQVRSTEQDPYQLGADVAGAYACAWFEAFDNAVAHDQADLASEAARVLGTSRDWPVLEEMNERGDYPEVIWELADKVATGEVPEGYREGIGCQVSPPRAAGPTSAAG
ncbi:hypothetical protein [Nocardioides dilutus]